MYNLVEYKNISGRECGKCGIKHTRLISFDNTNIILVKTPNGTAQALEWSTSHGNSHVWYRVEFADYNRENYTPCEIFEASLTEIEEFYSLRKLKNAKMELERLSHVEKLKRRISFAKHDLFPIEFHNPNNITETHMLHCKTGDIVYFMDGLLGRLIEVSSSYTKTTKILSYSSQDITVIDLSKYYGAWCMILTFTKELRIKLHDYELSIRLSLPRALTLFDYDFELYRDCLQYGECDELNFDTKFVVSPCIHIKDQTVIRYKFVKLKSVNLSNDDLIEYIPSVVGGKDRYHMVHYEDEIVETIEQLNRPIFSTLPSIHVKQLALKHGNFTSNELLKSKIYVFRKNVDEIEKPRLHRWIKKFINLDADYEIYDHQIKQLEKFLTCQIDLSRKHAKSGTQLIIQHLRRMVFMYCISSLDSHPVFFISDLRELLYCFY